MNMMMFYGMFYGMFYKNENTFVPVNINFESYQ